MSIFDNDGTINFEIGKIYDNDGTVNNQIAKVYDNDGTTNSLIYQDRFEIYTNGVLKIPGGWAGGYFRYNEFDKISSGGCGIYENRIHFSADGGYSRDFPARAWAATTGIIDLTPYNTATFDISVAQLSAPNGIVSACVYYGTSTTELYGGIGSWLNDLASATISCAGRYLVTVDVSNVNRTAGFGLTAYFGEKPVNVKIDCYNVWLE